MRIDRFICYSLGWLLLTIPARAEVRFLVVGDSDIKSISIVGFSSKLAEALSSLDASELRSVCRVYTGEHSSSDNLDIPSILGEWSFKDRSLVFEPKYPLDSKVSYSAFFDPDVEFAAERTSAILRISNTNDRVKAERSQVVGIYPSGDRLPRNILKFYVVFSRPMAQGLSQRYVAIRKESGEKLKFPFLELAEELWDPSGTRLTLLMDPGRVKQGLVPREEDGAIFEIGETYRLEVSQEWPMPDGQSLAMPYTQVFTIVEEDFEQPRVDRWTVEVDQPNKRANSAEVATRSQADSLKEVAVICVKFHETLDFGLAQRCLRLVDAAGRAIEGCSSVNPSVTEWKFIVDGTLIPGKYTVEVDPILEDLAGNSIERAFETKLGEMNRYENHIRKLIFEVTD